MDPITGSILGSVTSSLMGNLMGRLFNKKPERPKQPSMAAPMAPSRMGASLNTGVMGQALAPQMPQSRMPMTPGDDWLSRTRSR